MTLIRGGEERDLAAIAAMGQIRGGPFRFHLDRDVDFVQYTITKKRLLAGLGPATTRQLHTAGSPAMNRPQCAPTSVDGDACNELHTRTSRVEVKPLG